ncbi:NUDIX hydrolase [Anaerophilus nitritogenes]|uniref:NUDIX hydrolase n=1 Tax=Anaerophilus nitritogenes TaxID=2498136 RepID=UPI00101DB973|nr:NUDIX hydrolase [Anaerophilus nitritogenes]
MQTAGLGIVIKENDILLVHRKWYPMIWGPPGGFSDPGETIEETICREVFEETGIECKALEEIHDFTYKDEYSHSHIHVYACEYIAGEIQCSFESKEVKWFTIDTLPTPLSPEKKIFQKAMELIKQMI